MSGQLKITLWNYLKKKKKLEEFIQPTGRNFTRFLTHLLFDKDVWYSC